MTVQGCLEEALSHLDLHPRLEPSARTDAGVHALDQIVTFTAQAGLSLDLLRRTVNAHTPPDLLCLDAVRVAPHVHARASARSRTYVYLVGWPAPPELAGLAWSLPDAIAFPELASPTLDLGRAREALAPAVGEHDFAAFARPGEQTARRRTDPRATVRTVLRAEVIGAAEAPLAAFVLEGHGFLRAMVRNLVGAAGAAGVGATPPSALADALGQPERRYRGVRAPGWGLTLARVTLVVPAFRAGPAWGPTEPAHTP